MQPSFGTLEPNSPGHFLSITYLPPFDPLHHTSQADVFWIPSPKENYVQAHLPGKELSGLFGSGPPVSPVSYGWWAGLYADGLSHDHMREGYQTA